MWRFGRLRALLGRPENRGKVSDGENRSGGPETIGLRNAKQPMLGASIYIWGN